MFWITGLSGSGKRTIAKNIDVASDHNFIDARFLVQYIMRPYNDDFHDYRGYAGRVAGGSFKVGDRAVLIRCIDNPKIRT